MLGRSVETTLNTSKEIQDALSVVLWHVGRVCL
jgi:hypothetical protein